MKDSIKSRCGDYLNRAEVEIPNMKERENWKALSRLAKGVARNALQYAMIELRCNKDFTSAKALFERARIASIALVDIPENVAPASSFDIPMFCSLLAHDVDNTKMLAEVALTEKVIPGSHFDVHAKILSAFVLDDFKLAEKWVQEFDGLKKLYWWDKQRIYFDLYKAVLQRDGESFNDLLTKAVTQFKERETDKKFGDQLGEYGGLEYNKFAIDFMAIGIAIIAKSKGMNSSLDNDYFPLKLLDIH